MRANAAAQSGPLRRESWKGEDYIAEDVVAQREGVYEYPSPDPRQGVTHEFLSTDALAASADEWEGQTLVLRHPENEDGEFIKVNSDGVPITPVGNFRNVDLTDDALVGEVWIKEAEVGEHDGGLEDYVDALEAGEYGEVSTGYEVEQFSEEPGRYNGQRYDREQAALSPDHLALLPDEMGNCSVEQGCGVGRANANAPTPLRVNQTAPDPADPDVDVDAGTVRTMIQGLRSLLPSDAEGQSGPPTTNASTDDGDEAAESARDGSAPDQADSDGGAEGTDGDADADGSDPQDTDNMEDSDKIDTLVEEHGFDRANVEQWEGEDCLGRLFSQFEGDGADDEGTDDDGTDDSPESEDTDNTDADASSSETAETTATPDGGEDTGETGEVTANMDDIREVVREELTRAETESAKEENVDLVANNASAPFGRDDLEDMDADAVAKIADKYDTDDTAPADAGGQSRANYAGKPTGRSQTRANEGDDGPNAPAAGASRKIGAETEGDD